MIANIIFDWKRTLYNPEEKSLIFGSLELLNFIFQKNIPMVLIGKGGEDMYQEVDRLNIKKYFTDILFKEGEKEVETFRQYVNEKQPKSTLLIGDRVRSELEVGNILGATTVWVKQGQFATEEPKNEDQKPDFTVGSLNEVSKIISEMF